MREKERKQAKR
jgi:N12 class adenine-specific DNA methylase